MSVSCGQDVVSHSKKMKNKKSKEEPDAGDRYGIKGLSKGKRRKLEAYQHLFYLLQVSGPPPRPRCPTAHYSLTTGPGGGVHSLPSRSTCRLPLVHNRCFPDTRLPCALPQTNPSYLAKLIFQMPQNKSTKFMDTVIFTLYNYASNQREEYLLLKLFKTALEEEIE